jgi:hypothetical protein
MRLQGSGKWTPTVRFFTLFSQDVTRVAALGYPDFVPWNDMESAMDPQKTATTTDEIRINILDSTELSYWADKFGVSKDDVKSAVRDKGDSLTAVTRHLKRMHHA